jgi:hypothetical protein
VRGVQRGRLDGLAAKLPHIVRVLDAERRVERADRLGVAPEALERTRAPYLPLEEARIDQTARVGVL